MKTFLSFSALLILCYSCNTSAPKTEITSPNDTNAAPIADTVYVPTDSITQIIPPPTFNEFMVPKIDPIYDDINEDPPPIITERYQTVDAAPEPHEVEMGDPNIGPDEKICENPDERPEFIPADQLMTFINDNLTYPEEAMNMGITGIVNVTFIVERDGSIRKVSIQKSSGHAQLDNEAKRVIRKMPRWSPGKLNGQTVRCRATLPIHFEITE